MRGTQVSIGTVKRDISELINRVAYGRERIMLTSRGKPKAALVSVDDYERLIQQEINYKLIQWEAWQAENNQWSANILAKRDGVPFDTEVLWEEMRGELEARHDDLLGN